MVLTTYLRVTFAYDSTLQTGVKVCNLTSNMPANYSLHYYSKFMFRDPSTNAFQESVVDSTDDNKLINLDTDSYNLFLLKLAEYAAHQMQAENSSFDINKIRADYEIEKRNYKLINKSQVMKPQSTYYSFRNR